MAKYKKQVIRFTPPKTNIPVFKIDRQTRGRASKKIVITPRDKQIMELFSYGFTFRQIAKMSGLSHHTINGITERLRKDFKCKNCPHLVATFLRAKMFK